MDRRGFYWLIDGVLSGAGRPGRWSRRDGDGPDRAAAAAAVDEDVRWLRDVQGIGAVLSLTETPLVAGRLAVHGLAEFHLPIPDLQPPTPPQFETALGFIDEQRALDRRVLVHCLVGEGRTGTILAAYLIRAGLSYEEALYEVRRLRPQAIGSQSQEAALRDFAGRRSLWLV